MLGRQSCEAYCGLSVLCFSLATPLFLYLSLLFLGFRATMSAMNTHQQVPTLGNSMGRGNNAAELKSPNIVTLPAKLNICMTIGRYAWTTTVTNMSSVSMCTYIAAGEIGSGRARPTKDRAVEAVWEEKASALGQEDGASHETRKAKKRHRAQG